MKPDRARVVTAAAIALMVVAAGAARAQSPPLPPSTSNSPVPFLDVPFIQQSEALCGGAAAAMVMRFWGATGVYAETFSALVDHSAGGIRGEDLLLDLRKRGWRADAFRGDAPLVQAKLRGRQPVVALIEDRPGTFHYVVIVAWTNGRVVLHDPARAPFRVLAEQAFDSAWEKSNRWTLLTLPSTAPSGGAIAAEVAEATPREASIAEPAAGAPCAALVEEGVRTAAAGDLDAALRTLGAAADVCPGAAAPWREMAGVYALRQDWPAAVSHASQAVARDSRDEHAWRILAAGSFVTANTATALAAWNHVGEPRIDIVNVRGLEHTRHPVAIAAMRLQPQRVLTPGSLTAATRRLSELPAAQTARVSYTPLDKGAAAVDAILIERPRTPFSPLSLAVIGVRALSDRQVALLFANPTGAGDAITASWRWWENRPRVSVGYAAPVPIGGVTYATLLREQQSYATAASGAVLSETRTGGSVGWFDWTVRGMRWDVSAGLDSWKARGRTGSVTLAAEQRLFGDRVAITGKGTGIQGAFGGSAYSGRIAWRSSIRNEGQVIVAGAGMDGATSRVPLALWPGAGLGQARDILLRAHPLLDDGVITGEVFGRRVVHAGGEWRRWLSPVRRSLRIAPALFVDSARADKRLLPGAAWHVDAGAGLRIAVPGSGILRVDVATGLRDGATAVSVGWSR